MENRKAELIETLLPKDTNGYGNIFGGVIMSIMDKTAGVACWRYARKRVVTPAPSASASIRRSTWVKWSTRAPPSFTWGDLPWRSRWRLRWRT